MFLLHSIVDNYNVQKHCINISSNKFHIWAIQNKEEGTVYFKIQKLLKSHENAHKPC